MMEYRAEMNPGDSRNQSRNRVLWWGAVGLLVLISMLFLTTNLLEYLGIGPDYGSLIFAVTVLGTVASISIQAFHEALLYVRRQTAFVVTDSEIIRKRRGCPDLKIPFSEVRSLREELGWLIVKSSDQITKIAIPKSISGYDSILTELVKYRPLSPSVRFIWNEVFILLLSLISWSTILLARNIRVVAFAGIVATLTLARGSHYLWKLLHGQKHAFLWPCLVAVWGLVVLVILVCILKH